MSFRNTLEETAQDLATMAVPIAERVRETADDVFERLAAESKQFGSKVGDRVSERIDTLPAATLKRLDLVSAKRARRRTWLGVAAGVAAGVAIAKYFSGEDGAQRRARLSEKLGFAQPQEAAAITGDLPK